MDLFDLHCDTLGAGLHQGHSIVQNQGAVDLVRGAVYRPWVQAFAAWIPDGLTVSEARHECDALLDVADQWADQPGFRLVRSADGLRTPEAGCNALLTVENGGVLQADSDYLCHLFKRGVRLITLTWNGDNHWGCGCFGSSHGLTAAGRWAVSALERLGIVVDVSHLNETGFWQVEALSERPYVATHSAAATLCPHPRNLTDAQFGAIRDRGGVVGLSLYPEHLGGGDFETIRRHLEHFMALGGEHIVCIGADFDGMTAPAEWDGIAVMTKLKQYLQENGWSPDLLNAVFYTNARDFFLRYWEQFIRNEE